MDALSLPLSNHLLLVVGAHAMCDEMLDLVARMSLIKPSGDCSVRVVDGGNLFNAYKVAQSIRRQMDPGQETGLSLDSALRRIQLSRAFTCYQMVTLLQEAPLDATPTFLLDLLSNFYDEAVRPAESWRLLQVCLASIRRLSAQAPVIVSIRPSEARHADRADLIKSLRAAAGQVWEQKVILTPMPPVPWW